MEFIMNKAYKVIFNKARGVLMVANELTSSVQAKGTKTVVVAAVTALVAGGAVAKDFSFSWTSGNGGHDTATATEKKGFNDTLNMEITGTTDTRAYGLLATGEGASYTNKGTINLNQAKGNDATQYWRVKGMMADNNGTAINDGTINVTNAYGMTVGSTGQNTITNNGKIIVSENGAGMEVAPTGIQGSGKEGSNAQATNNGTIEVEGDKAFGVLMSGTGNTFTNKGTLAAVDGTAFLIQKEDDKSSDNNSVIFSAGSQTKGRVEVGKNVKNTTITFEKGADFDGTIRVSEGASGTKLTATGQTFSDKQTAISFVDGKDGSSIDLTDVSFKNNTGVYGGAVNTYATTFTQTGGSYTGNRAYSEKEFDKDKTIKDGAMGGALFIKGNNPVTFENVAFTNNSAEARYGQAYGGAILADYSTGNNGDIPGASDLIFKVTENLTYAGNTVSSASEGKDFNTYGYHVPTAAAGGFLFLDRGASAAFNVAEGHTLTIGSTVTDDDTDSIASSIPDTNTKTNAGKHALIKKEGAGELVINSNLDKYYGTVDVNGGQMTVNSAWKIKNEVTVNSGATLALTSFETIAAAASGNQKVDGTKVGGSILVKGTLQTSSGEFFTTALGEEGTAKDAGGLLGKDVTFDNGTLALTDKLYNLDYAQSAGKLITTGTVTMLGDLVNKDTLNEATLGELKQVGENVAMPNLVLNGENKNIQIGGTNSDPNTELRTESLSVGSINLGSATSVTIDGDKTLTLAGNGAALVKTSAENGARVVINNGTLALGGSVANGGTLDNVDVQQNGQVTVAGTSVYKIDKLSGSGNVIVGTDAQAGNLVITDLSGMTGMIFADPANAATVADASSVSVSGATSISAYLVAGRNALFTTDATKADGVSAFNKIAAAQRLSWGDDVTAALYVGKSLQLGNTGSVLVDGSVTSRSVTSSTAAASNRVDRTATVNAKGMLIVNQNAGEAIVDGNVILNSGSYLGVINAAVGEFTLATGDVTDNGTEVVTDNPFIRGAINTTNKSVVNTLDAGSGLGAVASTGVHAMARRADFIMTETVANRTSLDQLRQPGINLWVDVTGERYETDHFDNNGSFRADAGYATFGGDIEIANGFTAGLALQYGDASLRSDVSSIKNDITSYGVTAYAGKTFGAAKVVGELAWLKSDNDITAQQTALNQKLDVNIYSAGVRAQYELAAGAFKFVPSIGLRVSHLDTDDMNIGTIKIDDNNLTYVQMPISLRISGYEANASGWSVAPNLKVAYVPTFGDKEIKAYGYSQNVLDMSPVQADLGLRAYKGNLMLNADMLVGGGEAGTSSIGGKIGVKYAF